LKSLVTEKNLDQKISNKIDYSTFMQMVSSGTLNIIKFVKLDKSFLFIDDCGNEWIVEYDSMYYTPLQLF
jgi:hypothetical protein